MTFFTTEDTERTGKKNKHLYSDSSVVNQYEREKVNEN